MRPLQYLFVETPIRKKWADDNDLCCGVQSESSQYDHFVPLFCSSRRRPLPSSRTWGAVVQLLRALSLMSRAAIAVADDRSQYWRVEVRMSSPLGCR